MQKNDILVCVIRRNLIFGGTTAVFYKVMKIANGSATVQEMVSKREDIFNLFTHHYRIPTKKTDKTYKAKRRKIRTDGEGVEYVKVWDDDEARVWNGDRILCGTSY